MQDLEGKDEFRSCLQHEEARKNLLVEPIFNLIVAWKCADYKIFELILKLLNRSSLSEWEIFVIGVHAIVLSDYVLIIIDHSGQRLHLIRIDLRCFSDRLTVLDAFLFSFDKSLRLFFLKLNVLQLLQKIPLHVLTYFAERAHQLLKSHFFCRHAVFVLVQLLQEVSHIVQLALSYCLPHVLEERLEFFGQGGLIEVELLVSQIQVLYLLLHLNWERL